MTVSPIEQLLRETLGCDSLTFAPYIVTRQGRMTPDQSVARIYAAGRSAHLEHQYTGRISEDLFISWNGAETIWHRRIRNVSGSTLELVEMGARLEGIGFGADKSGDCFYHPENPRIYQKMAVPVAARRSPDWVKDSGFDAVAGTCWADPGVVSERVGASPYQPFPAVLLSNCRVKNGLVHGTLSQDVFFHNHLFAHAGEGIAWDILSSLKAVSHIELPDGVTLEDRWYLGRTDHADDIERVFENYARALRRRLPPLRGASEINRRSVVWGSWNDGNGRNIDEARLLKTADFLRDNLPTVEWMQIDSGYSALADKFHCNHGLGVAYEGDAGVDPKKFPRGLKAFTDSVKERGLKPAVWVGGYVPAVAKIARERPDWYVDYSYRLHDLALVFDVSKPEVREYMARALDYFTAQAGFEGIKLDFWSYAFEDSHPLLSVRSAAGYQWRRWWLNEIVKRLPPYGHLQTGCDIVMGNPFLAEWFTNYRYGIDIGGGNWEHVRTNFLWGAACFATHTGDLFVANSDSIGILPGLSDAEALTCINYCLISRSMVEVAGWLHQYADHPRMAWVRKALCCPNNGQDVFFAGYDYRKDGGAPSVWFLRTPHFSLLEGNDRLPRRTVAVFNLEDDERRFAIAPEKLGLPEGDYQVTDVWSLETAGLERFADFPVPRRSSRLLSISPRTGAMQVLDSNIKIDEAAAENGRLSLRFAHRGELVLVLSEQPRRVALNGSPLPAQTSRGDGNWVLRAHLAGPCVLVIEPAH